MNIDMIIDKLLGHRHAFVQADYVCHASAVYSLSAAPVTAKVLRCNCGEERRELTPAGLQQLAWGDDANQVMGLP